MSQETVYFSHDPTSIPTGWNFIYDTETIHSTTRSLYSTTCLPKTSAIATRADSSGHTTTGQDRGATFDPATVPHDVGGNPMQIPHPRYEYKPSCLPYWDVVPRQAVYRSPVTASEYEGSSFGVTPGHAPIFTGSEPSERFDGGALVYDSHPAYESLTAPSAAEVQPQYTTDPCLRQWIVPQTVYTRGYPLKIPVAPAVLNILVGDILHLGLLGQLRRTADNCNAAFPDPEGQRKNKKFTVRFAFEGFPDPQRPSRQINEYHRPEGSAARVPLSRIDFAIVVVDQLCGLLHDLNQPLRLRGHPVDIKHLVIIKIVRSSKASLQPVFMVHPRFWHLYG